MGYVFAKRYGYIHSSLLDKVIKGEGGSSGGSNGGNSGSSGSGSSGESSYTRGDVNDDGKITPADYVLVKNHIMGKTSLRGNALKAADMNKDNKVSPADYVQIKNKIMNR